jgi:hypothetical protein
MGTYCSLHISFPPGFLSGLYFLGTRAAVRRLTPSLGLADRAQRSAGRSYCRWQGYGVCAHWSAK